MRGNFPFLLNNIFTSYTLEVDFPVTYEFEKNTQLAKAALESIQALYDTHRFQKQNEHQFEDDFIAKVLEILGWHFVRQDEKIIQGKLEKPDFLLFASLDSKNAYQALPKEERSASNEHFSVILESKAYNVEVDNRKIKDNPHFQLLRYLSNLKKDFGFLTNGRKWRFYDNSKLSATKIFYEVDLESILQMNDEMSENKSNENTINEIEINENQTDDKITQIEITKEKQLQAFNYFYHIFNAKNFYKDSQDQAEEKLKITQTLEKNAHSKSLIEDDLQSIIYGINGKDSLFEKIGAHILAANPDAPLTEVYENALYFIFRLLFIVYFEDKFEDTLKKHEYFNEFASLYILLEIAKNPRTQKKNTYLLLNKLECIFRIYNEGNLNIDIPIFNGGLFAVDNAPLLRTPKIFNDVALKEILESLFYFKDDALRIYRRDYRTLSVAHLGTIYEGLLSYFFAIADEDMFYLVYELRKKNSKKSQGKLDSIEGYFDSYDYEKIAKDYIIHRQDSYKKGQLYLKNTSNSRKSTASFYTPESITNFLVQSALEESLTDSNILHFKILDNACGSGHFLVESLNQITNLVLANFDSFPNLKSLYEKEKQSIQQNVCNFIEQYEADESDILKRLLLKRVIFGLDLNPFSIELTKLSLWIDSFIFGTPLSFLEHHIKCGNALIGTSIAEFKGYYNALQKKQSGLFMNNFLEQFDALAKVFEKLDDIKDNNAAEVRESKRLYKEEIHPILTRLNLFLNLYNAQHFMNTEEKKLAQKLIHSDNIEKLANTNGEDANNEYTILRKKIEDLAKEYRFFNYEIEFPEIVTDNKFIGFQAIVGNPPWDKAEFSDSDFFPQYQSNYRRLSVSEKKELATNLLAKSYVKKQYDKEKAFSQKVNDYYKAYYLLNRGGKDLNLFRLFVERNLTLLEPNASLNYVLPSALMLEEGSLALRKEILESKKLNYFYSFENNKGIFKDVHRSYKFALMQIRNEKADPRHRIKTMFYKTDIAAVYNKKNIIRTTFKQIRSLSPTQFALQEVRGKKDLEILEKCYKKFTPLNAKWLDFRNELNLTIDKDLFIELHLFGTSKEELLPLYEGKMIWQFDSSFSSAQYFLDSTAFDARLKSKEIYRLKQDLDIDGKEYEKLAKSLLQDCKTSAQPPKSIAELEDSIIKYDRGFYRLGFRDIARDTDERTSIFTLLPKNIGCGNTLWSSVPKVYALENAIITHKTISHLRLCFMLGICNALVVDFIARGMVQIHLNKTYLERIPLPQPSDTEILESRVYKYIVDSALKLQLYNDKAGDFEELREEFGIAKSEIPQTQKAYDTLRAQLDVAIARDVYGLDKEDFAYLLESFKVLRNKQPHYIALLENLWE